MGPKAVASRIPDSQRPDVVGKATPERGGPRKSPDGVDPKTSGWASKRTRKTQRDGHNSGVKIWSLCSVSSTLSHATLKQPFRTLAINWEVNIFLKKSSCVVSSCVFLLRLSACVFIIESLWSGKWVYNKMISSKFLKYIYRHMINFVLIKIS